jgi:hypothetical protein
MALTDRVIASDKPSNPAGELKRKSCQGRCGSSTVLSTLVLFKSALKRDPDGAVTLEGSALQTGA